MVEVIFKAEVAEDTIEVDITIREEEVLIDSTITFNIINRYVPFTTHYFY